MPSTAHNNVWGSTAPEGAEEDLTLPSGQTCTARRVTIPDMVSAGILDKTDSLTALVDQHTRKIKGGKGADRIELNNGILNDGAALAMMIEVADRCMPTIVVSPPVKLHFTETVVGKTTVRLRLSEEDRNKIRAETGIDWIYTDQIDLEDKMHLFEWGLGGLKAFSSFRGGSPDDVGSVVPRNGPPVKAKRNPRNR